MVDLSSEADGLCIGLHLQRPDGQFRGTLALVAASSHARRAADRAAFLSPQEDAYFSALAFGRRQVSYLAGRYAAKRAAGTLLGESDGRRMVVTPGIFGQPILCDPLGQGFGIGVSISHSDGLACAVAFPEEHPMAVDVEAVSEKSIPIIASVLTAAERASASDLSLRAGEKAVHHTVLWTAKEALSKALRCGQMVPFEIFETEALIRDRPADARFPQDRSLREGELLRNSEWCGHYRSFGQYKFQSWADHQTVLTLTLPRRSELAFAP